eukprot:gene24223-9822_t
MGSQGGPKLYGKLENSVVAPVWARDNTFSGRHCRWRTSSATVSCGLYATNSQGQELSRILALFA